MVAALKLPGLVAQEQLPPPVKDELDEDSILNTTDEAISELGSHNLKADFAEDIIQSSPVPLQTEQKEATKEEDKVTVSPTPSEDGNLSFDSDLSDLLDTGYVPSTDLWKGRSSIAPVVSTNPKKLSDAPIIHSKQGESTITDEPKRAAAPAINTHNPTKELSDAPAIISTNDKNQMLEEALAEDWQDKATQKVPTEDKAVDVSTGKLYFSDFDSESDISSEGKKQIR